MWPLALVVVLTGAGPSAQQSGPQAIIPVQGGLVLSNPEVVNGTSGEQTDPHIDGDLVSYTDFSFTGGEIRYYDFATSNDQSVPLGGPGEIDTLSDVSGRLISFTRQMTDRTALMVYDVDSNVLKEMAPQVGSQRNVTAIGDNTVATVEAYDIFLGNVSTPSAPLQNVSGSVNWDFNPAVSPAGSVVVWTSCNAGLTNCGIMKSLVTGGGWSAAQVVSDTADNELNADTDGISIVYESHRPSATGPDIYWQPLQGGAESHLALLGIQRHPTIRSGVIAFESKDSVQAPADLYVYVIARNTVYQVTNTPTYDESLNDITVLPNGDIRVVYARNDDAGGENNIYAATFSLPTGNGFPQTTVESGGIRYAVRDASGAETGFSATFTSVLLPGVLQGEVLTGPPPPEGYAFVTPVLDIFTTGQVGGPIEVCFAGNGVTGSERLFHFEGEAWVDITVATATAEVCGVTASLSPFAVGRPVEVGAVQIEVAAPVETTYLLRQTVLASYTCTGAVATCVGTVASGAAIDTTAVGSRTFQVTATSLTGAQTSTSVPYQLAYAIGLLYDPTRAARAGSTLPIRVQLQDAAGANQSSSAVAVLVTGVRKVSDQVTGEATSTGTGTPDTNFRYDATLGGYIYNLSTRGLTTGTYALTVTVTGDPTTHEVPFEVR